ncbi:MAG TPA: hypothetical protein VLJ58_17395, partial [Ramlibacter sp.]|nr:hypothetical protein [Ramlibacter sp.]
THILATDAHSSGRRVPVMSPAREVAARLLGEEEAQRLVQGRPEALMADTPPSQVAALPSDRASPADPWPARWLRAFRLRQ